MWMAPNCTDEIETGFFLVNVLLGIITLPLGT